MVQFINVSKVYDNKIAAVDNLNFTIKDGEFLFLIGPSGSGKTTVIKMLIRDEIPSEGKIYFDDLDITKINRQQVYKVRREIGVIFQDYKLVQEKTAYENVSFAMEAAGKRDKEIRETVPYVLDIVGLSNRMKAFPRQLSGGEQQRVAIARAIANNPKILIADEPTGNLDPASAWDIVQILSKINNWGTTVIMSTHGTDIVNSLNKRVIQMEGGKVTRDDNKGQYEMEVAKATALETMDAPKSEKKAKKGKKTFFKTTMLEDDAEEAVQEEPQTKKNKGKKIVEKQIELSEEEDKLNEGDIIYKRRKLLGVIPFFGRTKTVVRKGIEEVLEGTGTAETIRAMREDRVNNDNTDEAAEYTEPYKLEDVQKTSDISEEVASEESKQDESEVSEEPKEVLEELGEVSVEEKPKDKRKSRFTTNIQKKDTMAKEIVSDDSTENTDGVSLKNKKVSKKKIQAMIDDNSTPLDVLDLPRSILKDLQIAGYKDVESVIKDGPEKLAKRITIDPEEVIIISRAIKIFLEEKDN